MGEKMRILCTILARGGSKGVPNKNLKVLGGKPLIAHTISLAKRSKLFDAIAVSSDSESILKTAKKWGVECLIKRPSVMAGDKAPKLPAIQHCVLEVEKKYGLFDLICDLDPTSPFRTVEDIKNCIQLAIQPCISNVISGAPSRKSPYFNLVENDGLGFVRLVKNAGRFVGRRQDSPACYDVNASIYVWRRESLLNSKSVLMKRTKLYVMPRERSIEIDTPFDFIVAEHFASKGHLK